MNRKLMPTMMYRIAFNYRIINNSYLEEYISEDIYDSYDYASNVLRKRFIRGEPLISTSKNILGMYIAYLCLGVSRKDAKIVRDKYPNHNLCGWIASRVDTA